jgi:mannose-1-phosphate guanylyltransferase
MFCWTLASIEAAFRSHLPRALEVAGQTLALLKDGVDQQKVNDAYAQMPRVPVDIGIMEPASNRAVIPVSIGWNDVGSWKALADISPADGERNHFPAGGLALSSRDNYIYSDKYVALIGVEGLCVVETADAILVCSKERSEDVKKVVEHLQEQKKEELL